MNVQSYLPKDVLLVAPQPFFRNSGTPLNVLNICRALTANGYEVDLLTIPGGEVIDVPGLHYHKPTAIPFLTNVPIGFSGSKAAYDVLLFVKMLFMLRRKKYLAIHAIEEAAFYAAPLGKFFNVPTIVDLDSDIRRHLLESGRPVGRLLAPAAHFCRRHALRLSTCAVTVARRLSEIVASESPTTPVFEIRDIVLPETVKSPCSARMSALKSDLDITTDNVVVYTGNFDSRQGLDFLLDALPIVCRFVPDFVAVLVGGDDAQIMRAKERVEELGCAHAVRFTGHRPIEEMHEFMALAGALVSPRAEPYVTPLKIYSYMASGRPIVATDMPTHTEVLDSNSAILVPPTVEGLADGILTAFENKERAQTLAANAQRLAQQRHSYPVFKREVGELYSFVREAAILGKTKIAPPESITAAHQSLRENVAGSAESAPSGKSEAA